MYVHNSINFSGLVFTSGGFVVSVVIKQLSWKQNMHISAYDLVAYDPVKTTTRLLESEAEAEEPTNHKTRN